MIIELYKSKRKDHGLTFRRGEFHIRFKEDGKQVMKRLGTADRKLARKMRDQFYAEMRKSGAVEPKLNRGRPVELPHGMTKDMLPKWVYYRRPWQTRVENKVIGNYATLEEAVVARNEYLKTQEEL